MGYTVYESETRFFDVHSTTKPLTTSLAYTDNYAFLCSDTAYHTLYDAGKGFETTRFTIKPIKSKTFRKNHFWRHYKNTIPHNDTTLSWDLQLPFMMKPKNFDLEIDLPIPAAKAKMELIIYLTAIGWMTVIKVSTIGEIDLEGQFIDAVRQMADKNDPVFTLGTGKVSISQIFRAASDELKCDLFRNNAEPMDRLKVAKNQVVSLIHASGPKHPFHDPLNPPDRSDGNGMSDCDKTLMYSVLYGNRIGIDDYVNLENQRGCIPLSFVRYDHYGLDFSLVDFRKGAFLFMQSIADNPGKLNTIRCLTANITNCMMMSLLLQFFYVDSERLCKNHNVIASLRENIKEILISLPMEYDNNFCRAIYKKGFLDSFH